MIGAMPAVAVRHERRRQEKRTKRPSQLYLAGQWMPGSQGSPPTPSPHGHGTHIESLPELYICGKISCLHAVVVCLLLGAVVFVVGLIQFAPGATTTDHRLALLIGGSTLLLLGIVLASVRCYVLHCASLPSDSPVATPLPPAPAKPEQQLQSANNPTPRDTLDLLAGHQSQPESDAPAKNEHHHHHHHHHQHHHGNHKKKRSSQGSYTDEA